MHQSSDDHFIPMTSVGSGKLQQVRPDVFFFTKQIVNVIFIGKPVNGPWVLIDAGMPHSGEKILEVARELFPQQPVPEAIILTHGHFDHVGGITRLLKEWSVQVYAHPLEFPYLTNEQAYPEPDVTVEGGLLAKLSFIYPHEPIQIRPVLRPLPEDGSLPHLDGWEWVHTPGHSPGHVSLFRSGDRTLIAGDAFVTVRTDSLYKVLFQKREVNGPPRYLTTDWKAAEQSVDQLQRLNPDLVITGHGPAMEGEELATGLRKLRENFGELAVPAHGKYV